MVTQHHLPDGTSVHKNQGSSVCFSRRTEKLSVDLPVIRGLEDNLFRGDQGGSRKGSIHFGWIDSLFLVSIPQVNGGGISSAGFSVSNPVVRQGDRIGLNVRGLQESRCLAGCHVDFRQIPPVDVSAIRTYNQRMAIRTDRLMFHFTCSG